METANPKCDHCGKELAGHDFVFPGDFKSCGAPECEKAARDAYRRLCDKKEEDREQREADPDPPDESSGGRGVL